MELNKASIASDSLVCSSCQDLKPLTQDIYLTDLTKSAEEGCKSCQLLQNCINAFIFDSEVVYKLQLFVDLSLFVRVLGKTITGAKDSGNTNEELEDGERSGSPNAQETPSEELRIIEIYTLQSMSDMPLAWVNKYAIMESWSKNFESISTFASSYHGS
jgi:hypothetical protein